MRVLGRSGDPLLEEGDRDSSRRAVVDNRELQAENADFCGEMPHRVMAVR